jgi:peptidoglycan biosynthesis protein MviN/MurJ (putative lipid II flippase)
VLKAAWARRVAHPNHQRIAKGALWMTLFVLIAKLCVAGKEIAIASRYGVSGIVDAYQLAFTITTWLPLMLGAVGTSVLVPLLVSHARSPESDRSLLAELNGWLIAASILVLTLTFLAGPELALAMSSRIGPSVQQLAKTLVLMLSPLAFLLMFGNYLAVRLQALGKYSYALWEAASPLGIVLFLAFLSQSVTSAMPLVWGTLLGTFAGVAGLWIALGASPLGIGGLALGRTSPAWRSLAGAFWMVAVGQFVMSMTIPIDQAFAARLGEGAVATLGYANRLIGLGTSLGTLIIARALLPVLSEVADSNDHRLGFAQTSRWALIMLVVGGLGALVAWIIAPWAVTILFQRGAFTSTDSAVVTWVLRWGLVQLPVYCSGIVFVQWLAAQRQYRLMFYNTVIATAAKLALNALLIGPLGLAGITFASALMYGVALVTLWAFSAHLNRVAARGS